LEPPKSNWAIRLDAPPFVAYEVTGGITYTYGDLKIDRQARVVDGYNRPIPGLFAAGEIVGGIFYHKQPARCRPDARRRLRPAGRRVRSRVAPYSPPAGDFSMTDNDKEIVLRPKGAGSTGVQRRGTSSFGPRVRGPLPCTRCCAISRTWGFAGSPRMVGSGFAPDGRETLSYIEGEFTHPGPLTLEGAAGVEDLLRGLHEPTASYRPPPAAIWPPWFGRPLGGPDRVIGHCDLAAWNIVARNGLPVALIDWETAGPVDPVVELAQACWLNAKLHADDVAEREGLPPLADRARQLRAILDAYGLSKRQRWGFVDRIIEYVVHDTAEQADEFGLLCRLHRPDATRVSSDLRAGAWRARAAAWLFRHRKTPQHALS
jgi:hypothetical protein